MQSAQGPQRVLASGSFTGYTHHRLPQLGNGYLGALDSFKQPLCGNEEGWGPLSPFRYDFTPCFIDVGVFSVASYGLLCGALALWYVLRKRKAADIPKEWHFWLKQVGLLCPQMQCSGAAPVANLCSPRAARACSLRSLPISPYSSSSRFSACPMCGTATSAS